MLSSSTGRMVFGHQVAVTIVTSPPEFSCVQGRENTFGSNHVFKMSKQRLCFMDRRHVHKTTSLPPFVVTTISIAQRTPASHPSSLRESTGEYKKRYTWSGSFERPPAGGRAQPYATVCGPPSSLLYKYGKIFFPYLGIKNMNIDYKKCHANYILIVCMRFVPKNTIVNAVDNRNLNTLSLSVNYVFSLRSVNTV
jgi:hypothetical protein